MRREVQFGFRQDKTGNLAPASDNILNYLQIQMIYIAIKQKVFNNNIDWALGKKCEGILKGSRLIYRSHPSRNIGRDGFRFFIF
jgi:hypothetical protein